MSLKQTIADLARPYTFYTLATAIAVAIVKMAWNITNGYEAAALAGVALAGASAIYVSKTFENRWTGGHTAEVEKARLERPDAALALAASSPDAKATEPLGGKAPLPTSPTTDDGELPLDQRVKL